MNKKQDLITVDQSAELLAVFVRSSPDFIRETGDLYNHMGATIADAVLQPRRDYHGFVTPKTKRIIDKWGELKTLTQLVELLTHVTASEFLNWEDSEDSNSWLAHRVQRFCHIVALFYGEGIETTGDLRLWLLDDSNLSKLYAIWGIGQKTVNYFGILVGLPWVAIDGRLSSFFRVAEIPVDRNDVAAQREIVCRAADLLSVDRRVLDHSIWRYMEKKDPAKDTPERASAPSCCGRTTPTQSSPAVST